MAHVLLDITRTLSRATYDTPTGIDRVEAAYIRYFAQAHEAHFIARHGKSLHIFARERAEDILSLCAPNLMRRLSLNRRVASLAARSIPRDEPEAISLPPATTYINVGHTNLNQRFLSALRTAGCKQILAMIHDTIPLDNPQFQTAASVARFKSRFTAALTHADTLICTSKAEAARVIHWATEHNTAPQTIIAPLGIEPPQKTQPYHSPHPYYVCLGTIAPRKNHNLLLDVWEDLQKDLGAQTPHLHLIGRRGWMVENLLNRLEASPLYGTIIHETGPLNDTQVTARIEGAEALLFPSFAEGYGLPLLEALQLGTRTICSDLAVFRELAGNSALYLDPSKAHSWLQEIKTRQTSRETQSSAVCDNATPHIFRWSEHFQHIETTLKG
jgi:glycosyltransferase involved in cell wall biosynthesis